MKKSNLFHWIESVLDPDECILGAVIGESWSNEDSIPNYTSQPHNKLISWDEAKQYLDYDFDSGFGGADCNPVYVWTDSNIIFVHEYDGATSLNKIPRFPCDCEPDFT